MVQINGGDDLFLTTNAAYKFDTRIQDGGTYNVTVATQPILPSQTCTVKNGVGTIQGRNVNVVIECITNKYTVGGTVTGLDGQVILQNDVSLVGQDRLTVAANGPFTFSREVKDGKNYSISVTKQPNIQTCTVAKANGTLKGANVDTVTVTCVDNVPSVSVQGASVVEGDTGTAYLEFPVSLSLLARYDITVHYTTSGDPDTDGVTDDLDLCPGTAAGVMVDANGCSSTQTPDGSHASAGSDYTATAGDLTIPAGTGSASVEVPVLGDTAEEQNETLTLSFSNPLMLSSSGTNLSFSGASVATGIIYSDDGGVLNDTGITGCANENTNDLTCNSVPDGTDVFPIQDAEKGRDFNLNDDIDGHAGFSFLKYGNDGNPLAMQNVAWGRDSASPFYDNGNEAAGTKWSCVLDQTTQLMWEVKTNDGDALNIHDKNWTYSWYVTDGAKNGGDPGVAGYSSSCGGALTACDTKKLVTAVNADSLCGYHDWRLPTVEELSSLIDSSVPSGGSTATIDAVWFPNTFISIYWTASPYASYPYYAWGVNFGSGGIIGNRLKTTSYPVRLVRGGQ